MTGCKECLHVTHAEIKDLTRRSELPVTLAMLDLQVSVLRRAHELVGNDLAAALIVCELAQRSWAPGVIATTNRDLVSNKPAVRFTSVNSLATVTGIPRETVRRRIADLVDKGWVIRDGRGSVAISARGALRALGSGWAARGAAKTLRAAVSVLEVLDRKKLNRK